MFMTPCPACDGDNVLTCDRCRARATIIGERTRQDARWGGPGHDDTHTGNDWGEILLDLYLQGRTVALAAVGAAIAESLERLRADMTLALGETYQVIERAELEQLRTYARYWQEANGA
jgi:hypothetical protein